MELNITRVRQARRNWLKLPHSVVFDTRLDGESLKLLILLLTFDTRSWKLSFGGLATLMGCTQSRIRRLYRTLESCGYIRREKISLGRRRGFAYRYIVSDSPRGENTPPAELPPERLPPELPSEAEDLPAPARPMPTRGGEPLVRRDTYVWLTDTEFTELHNACGGDHAKASWCIRKLNGWKSGRDEMSNLRMNDWGQMQYWVIDAANKEFGRDMTAREKLAEEERARFCDDVAKLDGELKKLKQDFDGGDFSAWRP